MDRKAFRNSAMFCALFAMALCSRLPGISFHSLWFDETSTANMVSQTSYGDMLKTVSTIEGAPPLFFYLEKAMISVFSLPVSETSLRILPMLFGAVSCLLFFLLFREIGSVAIGWQAFFLFMCSSYLINQTQEARCYSLLGCMVLLTFFAVFRWWKYASTQNTVFIFAAIAVTVQVHYHALLWITALFVAVFITKPKNRQLGLFLLYGAAAAAVSLALLLPLLLSQLQHVVGPSKDYLTQKWLVGLVYVPVKVMVGSYLFKVNSILEITATDLAGIISVMIFLGIVVYYVF